jgi:hypothetical protein
MCREEMNGAGAAHARSETSYHCLFFNEPNRKAADFILKRI